MHTLVYLGAYLENCCFKLLGFPDCYCKVEDVPDVEVRAKLQQIESCSDESHFISIMDSFPERYDCGYLTYMPPFSERKELVRKIAHHCIVSSNIEEIQQFARGLSVYGLLDILKENTDEAKKLLMFDENVMNSENVKTLFVPHFSKDEKFVSVEEDIIFNFFNFLDEVGNGKIKGVQTIDLTSMEDNLCGVDLKNVEKVIKLPDVLQFLTGYRHCSRFTLKIDIFFQHNKKGRLSVNTCNYEFHIPVNSRYSGTDFTNNIVHDILNSPGFGQV